MSSQKNHRFEFEEEDDNAPAEWEDGGRTRIYLDEQDPIYKSRIRFRLFLWSGVGILLLFVLGAGLYYLGYKGKPFPWKFSVTDSRTEKGIDTVLEGEHGIMWKERYYLPEGKFSHPLRKAIEYYKENNRHQAKRDLENFLISAATPEEKAAAAVYLGVMSLETERFTEARHQFLRALKFSEDFVPALVNLAITERRLSNLDEARQYAQRAYNEAPSDPLIQILLGNIQADSQDFSSAAESYKKGLQENPDDPYLLYNLALANMKQSKYDEAVLNFNRVLEKGGASEVAVQSAAHIAQIYYNQGRLEAAADYLKKATVLAPTNGKYLYNLGVVYLRLEREKEAAEYFKRALAAGSNESAVLRNLAVSFQKMNQPSLAIEALNKALYVNPDDLAALFQLADLYYEEKDLIHAAEKLGHIISITPGDKNTIDALLKISAVYLELERYQDAETSIRKSLKLEPDNARSWYYLGIIYRRSGQKDMAIAAWKKALGSDGDNIQIERDEERKIRLELAGLYRAEGAYELAVNEYRLILGSNSRPPVREDDPEIHFEMGKTFLMLKDFAAAIQELQKVEKSGSAEPEIRKNAFYELARAHMEVGDMGSLDQAKAYAYKAARIAPGDNEVRLLESTILLKGDSAVDRERAVEILMALTVSNTDPEFASRSYNLLGFAYYKNGEFSKALNSFDYALQLNPSNKLAYDNLRMAANAIEQSGSRR